MNSLRIKRVEEDEDVTCVRIDGRIAPETLASEGEPLGQIYGPQVYGRRLLMSMSGVDYINSNGIGWLIVCHKRFAQAGGMFVLHSLPPLVASVFKLCRMDQVFNLAEDADTARALACQGAR